MNCEINKRFKECVKYTIERELFGTFSILRLLPYHEISEDEFENLHIAKIIGSQFCEAQLIIKDGVIHYSLGNGVINITNNKPFIAKTVKEFKEDWIKFQMMTLPTYNYKKDLRFS